LKLPFVRMSTMHVSFLTTLGGANESSHKKKD